MEPYAEMYRAERLVSGMLDEFYFRDVDTLTSSLGLTWDDYSAVEELDESGRLPHEAALKLLQVIESTPVPQDVASRQLVVGKCDNLLTMLRLYQEWCAHPERIPAQLQGVLAGRAPAMADLVGHLPERRPCLALS
jgi:hypothetical protein